MNEFANLLQRVDSLGWLGFFLSPCAMSAGMAAAAFARRKGIFSRRSMFGLAGFVSLLSGYSAGRIVFTESGEILFASVAVAAASLCGFALGVRDPRSGAISPTDAVQQCATAHDQMGFQAGLASLGIAYAGVWSVFPTQGVPLIGADGRLSTVFGVVIGALVTWTAVGLHLIVGRWARERKTDWLRACYLVIMISASPAVLGLTSSRFAGNRWAGFLLAAFSLLVLWLEMRRLEKAFKADDKTAGT